VQKGEQYCWEANVIFLLVKALVLQATQSWLVRMGQGSVHPGSARRTRCFGAMERWKLALNLSLLFAQDKERGCGQSLTGAGSAVVGMVGGDKEARGSASN